MIKIIGVALILFFCFSCDSPHLHSINAEDHAEEIEDWYQSRIAKLKAEDGWLNLIGLLRLENGENSFGSGEDSQLKVDSEGFPEQIGSFVLQNDQVIFIPAMEGIQTGGKEVREEILAFDNELSESVQMVYQNYSWTVIKRGDAYLLRLRDLEAPALREFDGIERYPVDLKWRLEADFIPYDPVKEIPITNVLGQTTPNPSPGVVEFEVDGKIFHLDALEEGNELFLIFADETSGGETYGGGRYIYIPKPDSSGKTMLDFNKAYNPPCVFTPHATCPLPPRQNILAVAITAGEKNYK